MSIAKLPATAYVPMIRNILRKHRSDISRNRAWGWASKCHELDQAIEALDVVEAELRDKPISQGELSAKTVKT